MEVTGRIHGLEEAMENLADAFPRDARQQRAVLNSAMRKSAKPTILAEAKQRALSGDGSGALSESLGIRAISRRRTMTARRVAGVEIAPIRHNRKAMMMYINHYYTARGRTPPMGIIFSGIRHGHLVEFGTAHSDARPFLWPRGGPQLSPYMQRVANEMRQEIRRRLRRRTQRTHTGRLGR